MHVIIKLLRFIFTFAMLRLLASNPFSFKIGISKGSKPGADMGGGGGGELGVATPLFM